jgi:prepilin-type N-terminal cleavage/methylation domain-containing protein
MSKMIGNQNGFSIIEALVAIFIVGIVLIIYAASSNLLLLNNNARHLELAQRIAISEMEDLRATSFNSLPSSGSFSSSLMSSLPGGSGRIVLTSLHSSTKQITVTVNWNESSGKSTRSASFTTLKTKSGI